MATALARGCVQSGLVKSDQVLAADPYAEAKQSFGEQIPNTRFANDNVELLRGAQILVLAVKPQVLPAVLEDISVISTTDIWSFR